MLFKDCYQLFFYARAFIRISACICNLVQIRPVNLRNKRICMYVCMDKLSVNVDMEIANARTEVTGTPSIIIVAIGSL